MSRVRAPRDEWSRINDLETRIAALERGSQLNNAVIQAPDGAVAWSSFQAVSLAASPVLVGAASVAVSSTGYSTLGGVRWVDTGSTSIDVPVYVVPPAGGTVKVRLVDQSGVGTVIAEETHIGAEGYVVLTGTLGTTLGSTTASVRMVDIEAAVDSGTGSGSARLDAAASVH